MGPDEADDALETALLDDLTAVAGLRLAFRFGLIARLQAGKVDPGDAGLPLAGAEILLAMLRGAGAAEAVGEGRWQLTAGMRQLLARRGVALEARVRFIAMAAADLLEAGDALVSDPPRFAAGARTFGFFAYARALDTRAAALQDTEPWVRYVTTLAERESQALAPLIPLDGRDRLLEIGGNTGVFTLALLGRDPGLSATVLDLPAVCRLGADYVRGRPGADRLRFLPGDARSAEWPAADAVLFKSVLHDWTAEQATALLERAAEHLPPGGRVIVCERGPVRDEPAMRGAAAAANLVFAPFYRDPDFYADAMRSVGLRPLPRAKIRLDMTFHVTAGERAG